MKSFNKTVSKIKNPGILIYEQLQDLIVGNIVKYSGPWAHPGGCPCPPAPPRYAPGSKGKGQTKGLGKEIGRWITILTQSKDKKGK